MNDTTFKLRVPTSELEVWRAKAGKRGLSAWIRERCNGATENERIPVPEKRSRRKESPIGERVTHQVLEPPAEVGPASPGNPKANTCKHGVEKGWRCWQCGGLAVIE